MNTYDLSAGLFVRGLSNLKTLLTEAEAGGDAELLDARLATGEIASPRDLHGYTLAAHVHWAAEGANLAIAHLLGASRVPDTNVGKSFAELHQHLDATIAELGGIAPGDLEAGLERTIVIQHPRGATSARGGQFLVAMAIPHFYYHVTTAYGILRNQGVELTMADFLGNWGAN